MLYAAQSGDSSRKHAPIGLYVLAQNENICMLDVQSERAFRTELRAVLLHLFEQSVRSRRLLVHSADLQGITDLLHFDYFTREKLSILTSISLEQIW